MENQKLIKVKSMCLFVHEGKVLVSDGDSMKSRTRLVVPSKFYRVMGGTMNFDESVEECLRREIKEELDSEIEDLMFLETIENRFTYAGERGHEIVFMFKGKLAKEELTKQNPIHIVEDDYEFDAIWVPIGELLGSEKPLYPVMDYGKYLK